jgi:hypothetical protein
MIGGFLSNTKLKLQNGIEKSICNIVLNDILKNGEIVQKIIKINPTCNFQVETVFGNDQGFNIITNTPQEIVKCPYIFFEEIHTLYHLNTHTGSFNVNNIQVLDYISSQIKIQGFL